MAKPNVHTASRDELVEAGIRAELADEILKLRRKGKIDLETLEAVPGVGPATLEQLRKSLDFRDQPATGDDRGERSVRAAADHATEVGKHTIDQAAATSAHTVDQVVEAGKRAADQATEVTRELAERAANVAQQGLQVVLATTGTVRELPREVARRSTEGTAEIGRTLLSLAQEQTRQSLDIFWALTKTVDWSKGAKGVDWERVLQLQGELLRGSLDRSAQLTQRYLEVTQAVVAATASAARQQARKAA